MPLKGALKKETTRESKFYFMKTTITFLIYLLLTIAKGFGQCSTNVSDFGNNSSIPDYNINGDVDISLGEDGLTLTLDLQENFSTAQGPDIRAYAVNPNGLSDSQLANTSITSSAIDALQFGLVGSNSQDQNGAKTFTINIPEDVNIEDYSKVFFYCLEFDQFWDFGTFDNFNEETCDILSTPEIFASTVTLSPNPTRDNFTITGLTSSAQITIFDMLGKEVRRQGIAQDETISIASLKTGLYLVSITSDGEQATQKLFIQ